MNKGLKYDEGKMRVDLVEPDIILGISEVLTYGANKYTAHSWQNVDDGINRYYAAVMRHLLAWKNGEKYDKESNFRHLHHAASNLMFLLYHEKKMEIKNSKFCDKCQLRLTMHVVTKIMTISKFLFKLVIHGKHRKKGQ